MVRFVPSIYKPATNVYVRGLLYSWATEDDNVVTQTLNAKDQIFVDSATGGYLSALGSNVGVFRPSNVGVADSLYRELIPALSFKPKQITKTIKDVLGLFFGTSNVNVLVKEINPNEIVIQIPNEVALLSHSLKGSIHFHAYAGTITAVDDTAKTIQVTFIRKSLRTNELVGGTLGQGANSATIISNTSGNSASIQFVASASLASFTNSECRATLPTYPGSYLANPSKTFSVTGRRGALNQTMTAGLLYSSISLVDSSHIPNAPGHLVFNFGKPTEELVPYVARPNDTTLILDSSHTLASNHVSGELINFVTVPETDPRSNGQDYSIFIVGVTAGREYAQEVVETIVAAGIIIRWILVAAGSGTSGFSMTDGTIYDPAAPYFSFAGSDTTTSGFGDLLAPTLGGRLS